VRHEDLPFRRQYRFRLAGIAYLAVTGFIAVAAISSQNNLLFWCLGLATSGIAVSGIVSGAGLMGLRVRRELIADSAVGQEVFIRYRVTNTNRFVPAFGLIVYERPPSRKRPAKTPWRAFLTQPVAYVAMVGPGQTVLAESRPRALARGMPTFVEFAVASSFPFGLATKTLRFAQRTTSLIYPRPAAVNAGVLDTGRGSSDRAEQRAIRSCTSGEFFGLREYVSGDPVRAVAWKASARRDELVVCQYAQPAPRQGCVLVILPKDTQPQRVEETLSLAAGVLGLAYSCGYAFGLRVPDWDLALPAEHNKVAYRQSLAALAMLGMPDEATQTNSQTHRRIMRGSSLHAGQQMTRAEDDLVILVAPTRRDVPSSTRASAVLLADEPASWSVSETDNRNTTVRGSRVQRAGATGRHDTLWLRMGAGR